MNSMERMNQILQDHPEMNEKITAEIRRVAESGEVTDEREAIAGAVRTVLGIDLAREDLELKELEPEELAAVSGGNADKIKWMINHAGFLWDSAENYREHLRRTMCREDDPKHAEPRIISIVK